MPETPDSSLPLTSEVYLRLRGLPVPTRRRRRVEVDPDDEAGPFTAGRDPHGIDDVLDELVRDAGWSSHIAREDVLRTWAEVAGEETAAHAVPVGLHDGVLTVRCDSTAWMKQLSLLRAEILTRVVSAHPQAKVESIRFLGPDVPSWKWGPRVAPGRGPRDTYG